MAGSPLRRPRGVKMKWTPEKVIAQAKGGLHERMTLAMTFLVRQIQRELRKGGGENVILGGRTVNLNPSKPGATPHRVTGGLANAIDFVVTVGPRIVRGLAGVKRGNRSFKSAGGHEDTPAFTLEVGGKSSTTIRPKRGKFLRFFVGPNPETDAVFVKEVTIPPLKARPYLRPALARNLGTIRKVMGVTTR